MDSGGCEGFRRDCVCWRVMCVCLTTAHAITCVCVCVCMHRCSVRPAGLRFFFFLVVPEPNKDITKTDCVYVVEGMKARPVWDTILAYERN